MRVGNYIIFAVNILIGSFCIYFFVSRGYGPSPADGWKYNEIVSLLFAAATFVMAALTIVLAVLAVAGYTAIRTMAKEAAEAVASAEAKNVATQIARDTATPVAERAVREAIAQTGIVKYQTDELVSALSNE
ncbi:hypothetical protein [Niveispirillum lacus]|uniref:hypothetical protein n=1 Tax=Niveispirillum lacus TaxID=1981099 RepID=UPI0010549543|nr:hypothetical protein [Niveispirillum lacus]